MRILGAKPEVDSLPSSLCETALSAVNDGLCATLLYSDSSSVGSVVSMVSPKHCTVARAATITLHHLRSIYDRREACLIENVRYAEMRDRLIGTTLFCWDGG